MAARRKQIFVHLSRTYRGGRAPPARRRKRGPGGYRTEHVDVSGNSNTPTFPRSTFGSGIEGGGDVSVKGHVNRIDAEGNPSRPLDLWFHPKRFDQDDS
jgi:hypothetical protein